MATIRLSDEELLDELRKRFQENAQSLAVIQAMNSRIKKINEKLSSAEALRSHFLSNIRNEINNPLNAIMLSTDFLIKEKDVPADRIALTLRMIHSEAFNLDFQLRTIFVAAELEAGELSVCPAPFDMHMLINDIMDSFRFRAEAKRLSLEADFEVDLSPPFLVNSDCEKLRLVISNLLTNAIEYSLDEGRVFIKVSRHGCCINVAVADEGVGIDESDHERIFDRFVQLDIGSTKKHPGHGLGLSVARAILELLNGTITLKSARGAGSIFTISVPEFDAKDGLVAFSSNGCEFFEDEQVY